MGNCNKQCNGHNNRLGQWNYHFKENCQIVCSVNFRRFKNLCRHSLYIILYQNHIINTYQVRENKYNEIIQHSKAL